MDKNKTYRADIDGLRAVAVLGVVLNHLSASMVPGGYVGVDVFFVISGYLITRIISHEIAEGSFTFTRFYERRARRLFPALFAMLAVTLVAGYALLLPSDYASTLRATLGTLFFSSNVVFWREMAAGYFAATDAMLNPLLHTWSLGVEEQFYLVFPVLLIVCFRYFANKIALILLLCALLSLAGAAFLVESKSVAVFFLSPFRGWELLAGSLLAVKAAPPAESRVMRELLSGAGLFAILITFFIFDHKTTFPGLAALLPVLGAAAIIHAGETGNSAIGRLLRVRPIVYIGLISYSLYLWHWPLIVLFRYEGGMEPIAPHLPMLLLASLILGALSYHFIEQPFRRGGLLSGRAIFSSATVGAAIFVSIGAFGLVENGFSARFTPEVLVADAARVPKIPYRQCDGQPSETWCILGAEGKPKILVWGDSHAMAWAPALNEILSKQGRAAVLATNSACPPFFEIENDSNKNCARRNREVMSYLETNPEVDSVVLSAFWSTYFQDRGPVSMKRGDLELRGVDASRESLVSVLSWLRDNNKSVLLVGPVPVHENSVPLMEALALARNEPSHASSEEAQRAKHAPFFDAVASYSAEPWLTLLDPIDWMCRESCLTVEGGAMLYRDSHHLSVAGALRFVPELSAGMAFLSNEDETLRRYERVSLN